MSDAYILTYYLTFNTHQLTLTTLATQLVLHLFEQIYNYSCLLITFKCLMRNVNKLLSNASKCFKTLETARHV